MAVAIDITAAGWGFVALGAAQVGSIATATFAAIAPTAGQTTVGIHSTNCLSGANGGVVGDEFTLNDSGAMTFTSHHDTGTNSACRTMITTVRSGDTVWAACSSDSPPTAPGSGYTAGANIVGSMSAYKATVDPAGTVELVDFMPSSLPSWAVTAVTISRR